MAEAFLWHEGRAEPATFVDPDLAHRLVVHEDGGVRRRSLAREGIEEFRLPVARDAGNADQLALAHGEVDVAKRGRERARRGDVQAAQLKNRCATFANG